MAYTYPFHAIPNEYFIPTRNTPLKLRRPKSVASTRGSFFIKGGTQSLSRDLSLGGAGASDRVATMVGGMKFAKHSGETEGKGYFSSSYGAAGAVQKRLSEATGAGLPFGEQEKAGGKGLGAQLMAAREEEKAASAANTTLLATAVAGVARAGALSSGHGRAGCILFARKLYHPPSRFPTQP
jgi:hypothetical protein